MMHLQTFFKALVLLLCALATWSSLAHSVYDGSHDHEHSQTEQEQSQRSVDELIRAYSRSGDDSLLTMAWSTLLPRLNQEDATHWLQAAWLAQSEHNFSGALTYLEKVLSLKPRHGVALLLRANTEAVMGDLEAARRSCRQTFGSVELVVTQACLARLAVGKPQQLTALRRLQAWPDVELDVRFQAWIDETIALLATANAELATAEAHYRKALSLNPTIAIEAAYADVLLAQDRPLEVLTLIQSTEATPALALRRLLAAKAVGLNLERELAAIDGQFRQWHQSRDYRHAREMALFYAFVQPDLLFAKELAALNVASQKETIDLELAKFVGL